MLAEIRALLDDPALDDLDDKERARAARAAPARRPRAITVARSAAERCASKFTEKDGRVGYLIAIRPANQLDEWNGHDLIRFATAVRELHLPDGETVTTSGASVIFADIVDVDRARRPARHRGRRRAASSSWSSCSSAGTAARSPCWSRTRRRLAADGRGVRAARPQVNFLDFVALPITLGLGIDYAINVAHRHDTEEIPDPITTLRTSGSAVFVCSLTTMIGYGSLLVSENLAIRGFGTASLIGEVTCLLTALVLVPALLAVGNRRLEPSSALAATGAERRGAA